MPILTGKQQIAIKQEAAAGTAETLAAADVILASKAEWIPEAPAIPRDSMTSSLSSRGSVIGARSAKIRFKMNLRGTYNHTTGVNAAAAAGTHTDFDIPFQACGAAVASDSIYTPSSTTISDATTGAYSTIALYEDGKIYKIHGAVGNCVLTFQVGQPIMAEFEFTGVYNAPTDGAFLSGPVYNLNSEPPFLGASLSIIGSFTTAKISALKLDFGNVISMRQYPNSSSGFFTAQITARKPVGSIDPEEELAATVNFWSQWLAGTAGAITTGVIGGTANNRLNLNIPNALYTKAALGDREGIATVPLDFECNANTVAGDDEWSLTIT